MAATVMTVRGEVPVDQLGFTLPHEHVLIDLVQVFPANLLAFDYILGDIELAIDEVRRYVEAAVPWGSGRPALVDVTTDARMGRDPIGLRRVADALDLHLVMGCGRYREPWFEPELGRVPTVGAGGPLRRARSSRASAIRASARASSASSARTGTS